MPEASGTGKPIVWLKSEDVYYNEDTVVKDTEYLVLSDEHNVRLLFFSVRQTNDEQAAKDIEVHWILDGRDYYVTFSALDNTQYYIYANKYRDADNTIALTVTTTEYNCAKYCDKRALTVDLGATLRSATGTNQALSQWVLYERLAYTTV